MKWTLTILLIFGWFITEAQHEIFKVVEEMPHFPGCEDVSYQDRARYKERAKCSQEKLIEYIYQHLIYPEEARVNGIEGTVVVNFTVEKDGSLSNIKVIRGLEGGASEEALRLMNEMAENIRWIPGKQRGNPVTVEFNLPIHFKL